MLIRAAVAGKATPDSYLRYLGGGGGGGGGVSVTHFEDREFLYDPLMAPK